MTLFQKKCYRAILEGNRELLVSGLDAAAMPSLVNIQMELRKCVRPHNCFCLASRQVTAVNRQVTESFAFLPAHDAHT